MKQSSPTLCQEHLCSFAVLARTNIYLHSTGHRRLQTPVLCKLTLKEKGNLTAAEKIASPLRPQPHHLFRTSFATQMVHLGITKLPSQDQTLCIWTFQTLSFGYVKSQLHSYGGAQNSWHEALCRWHSERCPCRFLYEQQKQECYQPLWGTHAWGWG